MLQEKKGDLVILAPRSRLDTATAPELERTAAETIDGGIRKLIIDLSQVEYVSSAGLRVLLVAAKRLKGEEGHLGICSLNVQVKEVFELSGLTTLINCYESLADAEAALAT